MSKKKPLMKQKLAVGIGVSLIAVVLIYVLTLIIKDTPLGEYVEGEHYQLIENPRRMRGEKIQVAEVFSYACVHCYNLETDLMEWAEDNQQQVEFIRIPAVSNSSWRVLARSYYSMEILGILEKNHLKTFSAIHDKKANLSTPERFADFIDGRGTSKEEFLETYASEEVTRLMKNADSLQRRFKVATTPSLVIKGMYLVTTSQQVGRSRILDVVEHLVEKELAAKGASTD